MSYYPQIDYVGAMQGIANQFQDLPRVDREREATAMQRQLQNKQMTLYDLQARKAQMEMDQTEEDRGFQRTLGADLSSRQEAGDFDSTVLSKRVPDEENPVDPVSDPYNTLSEKTLSAIVPPKIDKNAYLSKKFWEAGKYQEAMKIEEAAAKARKAKVEEFQGTINWLSDIYKKSPTWGKNLKDQMVKQNPGLAMLGDFVASQDGEVVATEIKNKQGEVVAYADPRNPQDKAHWVKAPTEPNSLMEIEIALAKETDPAKKKFYQGILEEHTKRAVKQARDSFVDTRPPLQSSPYTDEDGTPMAFDAKTGTYVKAKIPGKLKKAGVESQGKEKKGLDSLKTKGGGSYKTPDDVKAAYKSGKIDKAAATSILQKEFGYK